jgi:hypothetical protein
VDMCEGATKCVQCSVWILPLEFVGDCGGRIHIKIVKRRHKFVIMALT